MKLTSDEMKELYRQQTARSVRQKAECLTEEMLVRAATEELSEAERERVADHLMVCSDCAEEYRIVRSLKPWAEEVAASIGVPATKPKAVAASHGAVVQTRLQGEEKVVPIRPVWWQRLGASRSPARAPYAIAAMLLILSLALGVALISQRRQNRLLTARLNEQSAGHDRAAADTAESLAEAQRQLEEATRRAEQEAARRRAAEEAARGARQEGARADRGERTQRPGQNEKQVAELRRTVDQLSQPQINVPITDLDPQGSTRGQTPGAIATVEVPRGANLFTLILNVAGQTTYPDYALEVSDGRGRTIFRSRGLRKSPYNTFTVALPRRSFPAGQYRIKLYGLQRDGRKESVEDYAVRVQYR